MNKKLVLIIFTLLFLSGCTVKYDLTIDEKGKITEKAVAMEDSEFFEQYDNSSIGRVVGFLIEPHANVLNENSYLTKSIILSKEGGAEVSKEYSNAEDYANNTILVSQFADKVNYSIDGSNVTLSVKGKLSASEQNQEIIPIGNADITISLPFKVEDSNADEVVNNKYIWHLKAEEEKEIKITYNKNKIAKKINYPAIILGVGIIVVIVIGGLYVYNIKNKSEEINKI